MPILNKKDLTKRFFFDVYELDEVELMTLDLMGGGSTHEELLAYLESMQGKGFGSTEHSEVMRTIYAKVPFENDQPEILDVLAKWIHRGERPNTGQRADIWYCPDPPKGCGTTKDGTDFPLLEVDDERCKDCIRQNGHKVKTRLYADGIRKALDEIFSAIQYSTVDVPKVNSLLDSVVKKWGGAEEVGSFWYDHIQKMAQRHPGSKEILGHMRDFSRFWLAVEEKHRDTEGIADMADDELKDYLSGLVVEQLAKKKKDDLLKVLIDPDESEPPPEIDRDAFDKASRVKKYRPPKKKKA